MTNEQLREIVKLAAAFWKCVQRGGHTFVDGRCPHCGALEGDRTLAQIIAGADNGAN